MCTPDWVADWVNVTLCPYEEWPEEVPRDMVDDGSDSKSEGEDGDEEMTDADDDGNQVERLGERMDGVGLGS